MVVVSAAQQSRFFQEIAQNVGFWGGLAQVCGLIGFTVAVIGGVMRRVNLLAALCWLAVMVVLFVAPTNAARSGTSNADPLFFTAITPQTYKWTQTPYPYYTPPEADENGQMPAQQKPKRPIDDLQKLEQMKKGKAFYLFTPQLATIDALNRIRVSVSQSFVRDHEGYKAPVADFSAQFNASLKPLAGLSHMIFGNIDKGTYAALLPMLLTFMMVVVIVCTPFILMLAAAMPQWAPGLLLLTVGGVAYTKVVEVMFALIRGVFGLFLDLNSTNQPGHVTMFNEVLLGLGYLVALAISVWLVFKIRRMGKNAHHLLQDFVRETRAASHAQQQAASQMAQHTQRLGGIASQGMANMGSAGGISAPLQQLPFDAARHEALRPKAANQKSAEELRAAPPSNGELAAQSLERAFAKTKEDALNKAKQEGVPNEASMPRAAKATATGQKAETVEPALSKVAKTLGGHSPEELGQSYQTATQLFSTGALTMRMDDQNMLRVEVNLQLEIMQTLSPDLQDALTHLQAEGHITRALGADQKPFFALAE